jgi:hypothetical protein
LATGCNLLAQPLPNREMTGIVQALEFLFGTLPKPLVLKSDNEFDADLFAQCLVSARGIFSAEARYLGFWTLTRVMNTRGIR